MIDGQDSTKTTVPRFGDSEEFEHALSHSIIAGKVHGFHVTLYPYVNTVHKGVNLSIYCMLLELEAWRIDNGRFPEEIFIQTDGGCEYSNTYVPPLLELLVSKRLARVIYWTRLPVGHTHEDIDGKDDGKISLQSIN